MELHQLLAEASIWLWPQIANHLWQATLFALLALGVVALIGRGPARARYFVWLIASAKFALPSVLIVLSLKGIGIELPSLLGLSEASDGVPVIVQFAEPVNQFDDVIAGSGVFENHSEIYCLMSVIWISGSVFFFALWMRRRFEFGRAVRAGTSSLSGREIEALNRVLKWFSMTKEIRLAISPSIVEPGVWGIAKPVVVLPEKIASQLSDAELEAVIMHEIVHVERRDNLTATLQMILCCIFWFHPVVWLIDRRMLAEREQACDERVVELGGASGTYASSLLKVLEFCLGLKTAGVSSAAGSNLRRRIEQIMDNNFVSKIAVWHRVLIGALVVLVMIFSVATGLISRDSVIAGQSEAKQNGVRGGVEGGVPGGVPGGMPGGVPGGVAGGVAGGIPGGILLSDDNVVYLAGSKQMMMLQKEQVSDINKEMDEAPFIVIQSEDSPNAPLRILDAKIKAAKVAKLYNGDGVEWTPSVDQYAVRPCISLVNNTNRRITGIVLEFKRENISYSVMFYNIPSGLEPGVSYESGLSRKRLLSLQSNPESLVVKVGGARFDNGEVWGKIPPPPPPPPPPPIITRRPAPPIETPASSYPPKVIRKAGGAIQGEALRRVTPSYPQEAKEQGASGTVVVEITIDEEGNVIDARALDGHDKLKGAAIEAARQWQFKPTMLDGQPVKVIGTISFIFQP